MTFVHELNNQVRAVPLHAAPADDEEALDLPYFEGHATAHYEANALVIRTVGFNTLTFLDASGLPHSDELVTTERIRRIGDQLEDLVTVHDPIYYSKDWQAKFTYQRQINLRLHEYICGESHRDISRVKGILEARALRAKGLFP